MWELDLHSLSEAQYLSYVTYIRKKDIGLRIKKKKNENKILGRALDQRANALGSVN